jgi:hypothetical protein
LLTPTWQSSGLVQHGTCGEGHPPLSALGIAAGSAVTFLGLLDLLYDLEHGKYKDRSPGMTLMAADSGASLTLGPITMVRKRRPRHRPLD